MNRDPLVALSSVSLRYKSNEDIFWNLDLAIYPQKFYFLTGPSGVGKTSLLKLIYMDVFPTSGEVYLFGKETRSIPQKKISAYRQKLGIVLQDSSLFDHMTLLENVALPLRFRGASQTQAEHHAAELLNWVGLSPYFNAYPPTLSGGQKQRAAIARAVITSPQLVLADEPTGNVDKENATKILYLFEELHRRGTTIIFATHDRELASHYPYQELLIQNKRIVLQPKKAPSPSFYGSEPRAKTTPHWEQ